MDGALPTPSLPSARRRVARTPNGFAASSPTAGPSRHVAPTDIESDQADFNFDGEPSRNLMDTMSDMELATPIHYGGTEETPAARLRKLMTQLDETPAPNRPQPASPSDRDSDYEQPSRYKSSLRSLMDHALRPPGSTPQKKRRNSIDTGEVEADGSPHVLKVRKARDGIRHKRKSHSDEEVGPDVFSDVSSIKFDASSWAAHPSAAHSQTFGSLQSFLQTQSNLLDFDMQNGLPVLSSEDDSPVPPIPPSKAGEGSSRLSPETSRAKSSPERPKPAKPQPSPSRIPTSTLRRKESSTSLSSIGSPPADERVRPRTISKTTPGNTLSPPSHPGERSTPPSPYTSRLSFPSSRPSPENEGRDWNKPRPRAVSRPTPSPQQDHPRTFTPVRSRDSLSRSASPSPYTNRLSSPSPSISSRLSSPSPSINRLSFPGSRSSSAASSRSGEELEPGLEAELQHERERNWSSPRPSWPRRESLTHSRSNSPILSPPNSTSLSNGAHLRPSSNFLSSSSSPRSHSPRPGSVYASTPSPSAIDRNRRISLPTRSARPNSPLPPITPGSPSLRSRVSTPSLLQRSSTDTSLGSVSRPRLRTQSSLSFNTRVPSPQPPPREVPVPISKIYEKSKAKSSSRSSISIPTSKSSVSTSSIKSLRRTKEKEKEVYDGHTTETDEDTPQESTPTLNSRHKLPPPVELEQPPPPPAQSPSPPPPPPAPPIDAPRLNRAMSALQSPPLSPPSSPSPPSTPPASTIVFDTPPPKISVTKVEYQTPSPPRDLPDLPGPPSSGSDEEIQYAQDTMTKTPRPPGAWAYTPAPRPTLRTRSNSVPTDDDSDQSITPVNTTPLSRAQSLPTQTPAPPGAWLMTPAANKKSVRFDPPMESDMSSVAEETEQEDLTPILKPVDMPPPSVRTPPASPSRSRREPRIRMMDEYGREVGANAENDKETERRLEQEREEREKKERERANENERKERERQRQEKEEKSKRKNSGSLRNQSKIRIVDATGRVVEEPEPPLKVETKHEPSVIDLSFSPPPSAVEAKRAVESGLGTMEAALDEEIRKLESKPTGMSRVKELEQISIVAREERRRLHSGSAESVQAMRRSISHAMMQMQDPIPVTAVPPARRWLLWFSLGLLIQFIIGFVLFGILYRMTIARTYELFVTTYYDPFAPQLFWADDEAVWEGSMSVWRRIVWWVNDTFLALVGLREPPQPPVHWGPS